MNQQNIKRGLIGGLVGGVVFGVMMQTMGMIPMIGRMIGQPTAVAGWVVHLGISAFIGASFALLFERRIGGYTSGVLAGMAYGAFWWLAGPLTLMPFFMGMGFGVNWNTTAATAMLPSLMGHLIFGVLLGATFAGLTWRVPGRGRAAAGRPEKSASEEVTA